MTDNYAIQLGQESQRCWLHRSLSGEYLALTMMIHAGFGAVAWGIGFWEVPARLCIVAAGVWVVGRAGGAFSGSWFTPLVTVGLAIALAAVWQADIAPSAAGLAVFSPLVFLLVMGVILFADLIELAPVLRSGSATSDARKRKWRWLAIWGFALAFVIYMVIIPTAAWIRDETVSPTNVRKLEEMSLAEEVRLRSMEAMTALWFFALGATIGSFLNVVAYRVPRGESLVFRRSRCPRCGTQIKGRDNVPILGWLLLDGKCRECQASISARYPIVESITAGLFLWLYFIELISGGANIPVREPNHYIGVVWIIFYTKWDLVGMYLYHCFALSVLIAGALIDRNRQTLSARVRWFVGLALLLPPLIWPALLPVPFLADAAAWLPMPSLRAGITCLLGGLAGAALGWLTAWGLKTFAANAYQTPHAQLTSGLAVVGISLGWQAAIAVTLFYLLIRLAFVAIRIVRRWSPPPSVVFLMAFVIHQWVWRWTVTYASPWWPSHTTSAAGWSALAVGYVLLLWINSFADRFSHVYLNVPNEIGQEATVESPG